MSEKLRVDVNMKRGEKRRNAISFFLRYIHLQRCVKLLVLKAHEGLMKCYLFETTRDPFPTGIIFNSIWIKMSRRVNACRLECTLRKKLKWLPSALISIKIEFSVSWLTFRLFYYGNIVLLYVYFNWIKTNTC